MANISNKETNIISATAANEPIMDDDDNPLYQVLKNPLLMDEVFSTLFKNDLKNFRLVSSVCSQVGTMTLFKKASRLVLGSIQMEHLKKLIDMILTSSIFHCSKFCFRTGLTKNPEHDAVLNEFFNVVSPFITELIIIKRTRHTIFCQNPKVQNQYQRLTTIKIMHNWLGKKDTEDWAKDVEFLTNVITHTSSLNTVAIVSLNYDPGFITKSLSALDNPQGRKIKYLELKGIVETQHLELANSLGLSLNTLTLEFLNLSEVNLNSISTFLETQADTLQELEIGSFPVIGPNAEISFPRMNKLKALKLSCKFCSGFSLSNIWYNEQFPTLNKLTLNVHFGIFGGFPWTQPRCDTVTTLELPTGLTETNTSFRDLIQNFDQLFPNLKKLRVPAWKDSIGELNRYMRHLEELTLTKGNQNDCLSALTGYTITCLDMIQKHLEDQEELVLREKYSEPLDFLQDIKVLKIEQELERDFDLVYYLGLKKLRSLKCLNLRRGESSINPNKVNEQTLQKMREQFEVLILEADIIRGKQPKQWKRERNVEHLGIFFESLQS